MNVYIMLRRIAGALFVLSLLVLFGTLSLRWMVSDLGWYQTNFEQNRISERTGIPASELSRSASQISRYLLLDRDGLDDLSVTARGEARPLFNDREKLHLGHVRDLLRGFYLSQVVAVGYVLLYLVAGRLLARRGFRRILGRELRWAGVLTLAAFGAFGLVSMLSFDELFLQFHVASFQGDCWLFDPATDNLVAMFPQNFWNDSALRLAALTAAQAVGSVLVGTLLLTTSSRTGNRLPGRVTPVG